MGGHSPSGHVPLAPTHSGIPAGRSAAAMLSPKMQRGVRINDNQLLMLAEKARYDQYMCGSLYKRTCDNSKWQLRWFNLYQVCVR